MQETTFEVYKVLNIINNKVYIGCTTEGAGLRFRRHIQKAKAGSSYPFHKAIVDFGETNFKIEILEMCDSLEEMNLREVYYIALFSSTNPECGYNERAGGGVRLQSKETREKIGDIHGGKVSEKRKPILQYSAEGEFIKEYQSLTDAGEQNGITRQSILRSINKIVLKPTKKNPYIWMYKDFDKIVPTVVDPREHYKNLDYTRVMSDSCLKARERFIVSDGNVMALSKCVAFCNDNGEEIERYTSMSEASRVRNVSIRTIKNHIEKGKKDWKFVEDTRSGEEIKTEALAQAKKAARSQGISVVRTDTDTNEIAEFDTIKDAAESVKGDRKALRYAIDSYNLWKGYRWKYKQNNTQQEAA